MEVTVTFGQMPSGVEIERHLGQIVIGVEVSRLLDNKNTFDEITNKNEILFDEKNLWHKYLWECIPEKAAMRVRDKIRGDYSHLERVLVTNTSLYRNKLSKMDFPNYGNIQEASADNKDQIYTLKTTLVGQIYVPKKAIVVVAGFGKPLVRY